MRGSRLCRRKKKPPRRGNAWATTFVMQVVASDGRRRETVHVAAASSSHAPGLTGHRRVGPFRFSRSLPMAGATNRSLKAVGFKQAAIKIIRSTGGRGLSIRSAIQHAQKNGAVVPVKAVEHVGTEGLRKVGSASQEARRRRPSPKNRAVRSSRWSRTGRETQLRAIPWRCGKRSASRSSGCETWGAKSTRTALRFFFRPETAPQSGERPNEAGNKTSLASRLRLVARRPSNGAQKKPRIVARRLWPLRRPAQAGSRPFSAARLSA